MAASFIQKHKLAIIIASVGVTLCLFAVPYFIVAPKMESCTARTLRKLAGPGAYSIVVVEKGCDGVVGSDTVDVELIASPDGRAQTVFLYGREVSDAKIEVSETYPQVMWESASRLKISVKTVSYIEKRVSEMDGVQIEYNIGSIEYK